MGKTDISVQFRKLRAGLNMITTKMVDISEESNVDLAQKQNELKPVFQKLAASHQKVKESAKLYAGSDADIEQLVRAVDNGLHICQDALNPEDNPDLMAKKMRSAQASYYTSSNQMHNMRQVKKMRAGVGVTRNEAQLMQSDLS